MRRCSMRRLIWVYAICECCFFINALNTSPQLCTLDFRQATPPEVSDPVSQRIFPLTFHMFLIWKSLNILKTDLSKIVSWFNWIMNHVKRNSITTNYETYAKVLLIYPYIPYWSSSHYAVTHVHNKTSNIQGSSPNVVKVNFHTIRNCS